MSPAVLGFLRGIGMVVLIAVLTYVGDAAHLSGLVSPAVAGVLASLALALENHISEKTGKALFGAVRK